MTAGATENQTALAAVSEEEQARANTYSLLGAMLGRAPGPDILGALKAIPVTESSAAPAESRDMFEAWSVLQLAAERAAPASVAGEFHELFVGIGRGELVPFGSWYLTGFMMEKPLAVLRRDLAALGFARQEGTREPEDHVGALCETMAMIINSSEEFGFDDQQRFFADHMEPWMGKFFSDLQMADAASFYTAVGKFGESFIGLESRYFAMTV